MSLEIKRVLSREACQQIVNQVDQTIESGKIKLWSDDIGCDIRIFHAEKKVPEFYGLYETLLDSYVSSFAQTPDYSFLMINRVNYQQGNLGSGGGWHRDSWFNQKKAFVFLSDVEEDNGPFEYVDGSQSLPSKFMSLAKNGRSVRFNHEGIDQKKVVTVCGAAGEGFCADTTCIHRGRPIQKDTRYMATLYAFHQSGNALKRTKANFVEL